MYKQSPTPVAIDQTVHEQLKRYVAEASARTARSFRMQTVATAAVREYMDRNPVGEMELADRVRLRSAIRRSNLRQTRQAA
jgi:hypothetical protein